MALGRSWHPEEFTCSQCKVVLDEGGFFEERGAVFCTKCYDNRYAPNCAKCKKKITGVRAAAAGATAVELHCYSLIFVFSLFFSGNHARPEDDLPRAVFQVCSLQDAHQEPGFLHGGGGALL